LANFNLLTLVPFNTMFTQTVCRRVSVNRDPCLTNLFDVRTRWKRMTWIKWKLH